MKTGIVTTLIALCLPVSVFATTLRLSADIDLLVLDGKKVSNSLLCDADNIELDNKLHQLVSRIERMIHLSNNEERLYISPLLVVSSNTQLINQVNLRLPHLENEWKANRFGAAPHLELLDGDAMLIPVKLDVLAITSTAKTIDYEVEVGRYNKSTKHASLPQFTTMMADDGALLSGISRLDTTPP